MGNTSNTSASALTAINPVTKANTMATPSPTVLTAATPTTKATTMTSPSPSTTKATTMATPPPPTTRANTMTTPLPKITTPSPATTPTTAATMTTTASPINTVATTTTTMATATTPTPTITSTAPATKVTTNTSLPPTEGISKPTFYSVAKSLISDDDKTKTTASSAYSRWYKWSKLEQQKRDKGKPLWYMNPSTTSTDIPSATTTTLTTTTAKINSDQKETSDTLNVTAIPSFQLRSTAVYSPPHGDRILSGRSELVNTDTSIFKYYLPDNRSQQSGGIHTKATMYRMNTHLKKTPLPVQSTSVTNTNSSDNTNVPGDNLPLPTYVSRGLQTDLEPQPASSSSTQTLYYEKQQPQIVPVSAFSNSNSNNNGFFHLASNDTDTQPVLPPIEKTPVRSNDQARPSLTQSVPSYPPAATRPSILKKPSTVLSQEKSNPLSSQTHDKVLEELRKRNKDTQDGTYRVKKIHILEKSNPDNHLSNVSFNLPPLPPTKASQSISKSEKLFSS